MAYRLLGQNFTPPDVEAKVTGRAKYAEDFRADGMAHVKFLGSPVPHGRVRGIDTAEAERLPGVLAVLRPDEVKAPPAPGHPILWQEPAHYGAPVVAVAAETEQIAAEAVALIRLDIEERPFIVDPLDSLKPAGADARRGGNVAGQGVEFARVEWTGRDLALAGEGRLPEGAAPVHWQRGDPEGAFARADLVLDETVVHASNAHHSMEPRSAAAWWQGGRCHVRGSTQSTAYAQPGLAAMIGIEPGDLVLVAEFCGGGFGSKAASYPLMALPAVMSRKLGGRPCLLRVSRREEYDNGAARAGFQAQVKLGFAASGRLLAADLFLVQDSGATSGFPDFLHAGDALSIVYRPEAMRLRAVPVLTNTVPKSAQRGPGENQLANMVEPLIDKAARQLGLDRLHLRRINAPGGGGAGMRFGARNEAVTSAYLREALEKGAARFGWRERAAAGGKGAFPKLRGLGIGQAFHVAGFSGFDGLVRIAPDGRLHVHTGVGNLGTYSYAATCRVAAEVLGYDWRRVVIERGGTARHLPWNLGQFSSNTSFTMARTNYVAAMDAAARLREIAAVVLGGVPEDYVLRDERVVARDDPERAMTFAEAARRAIATGGRHAGHDLPDDLDPMTRRAARALAGSGLIGVARDGLEKDGAVPAFTAAFIEIELDVETGMFAILDYLAVADCGTVLHPQGLAAQIRGGAVMGFGLATRERHVYDPAYGHPDASGLHRAKPLTMEDIPARMDWAAVAAPDGASPMGSKGIGEPVEGAASSALLCAISDALGGHVFNRVPVTTDMIVTAAAGYPPETGPLATNTV